jgi:protein gp37
MNPCKKSIGWADYTWNPVVGCKHGCSYCYAKRMNDRFKWIPEWTNPVLFHNRLDEPSQYKKPLTIFVGSMCDLFGEWVCSDWIATVINVCEKNPQHTFMFLTKNPRRYLQFDYPDNVMLGMTLTNKADYEKHFKTMMLLEPFKTFVSIEPILGDFERAGWGLKFNLVIIGAQTGRKPIIPERKWIDSFYHPNIYYKKNILKYFPDLKN